MRVILFTLSVLSAAAGALVLLGARSAIHETEAFVLFLIAATFLSSAAIIEAIKTTKNDDSDVLTALRKMSAQSAEQMSSLTKIAGILAMSSLPAAIPGEEKYFVGVSGRPDGPFSITQLKSLITNDVIGPETSVLLEGTREWKKLGSLQL